METVTQAEEEDDCGSETSCLMRVGKNSDWLRLLPNTEVTIGRGLDVTYPLLSPTCPLMISRLHCTFKQKDDGQWMVIDKKSLNGVWVNGNRIPAEEPHQLKLGDSIQLGVPVVGAKAEFDYILVQRPLKDIKHNLAKGHKGEARATPPSKKSKRKLAAEEVEPSTSKSKLYRCNSADKSFAQPCPLSPVKRHQRLSHSQPEAGRRSDGSAFPYNVDNLLTYSQNILLLREQVDSTQKQVASLEEEPQPADPLREEQVREMQGKLETVRTRLHHMETLEKSFKAQKTQQQAELLEQQLEEALQEQKKVIDELTAKNKELEVTKEEKEKARAQKEEVVTQVTEVLENELQCIICSELFIEAVILNCAHSFCSFCIKQWRKKKDECPICRQAIQSQTRCLALDNCITSMVENLSLDMKARRQTLITERKEADSAVVTVIDDDDDSSHGSSRSRSRHRSSSRSHSSSRSPSSSSPSSSSSYSSMLSINSSVVSIDSSISSVISVGTDSSSFFTDSESDD